MFSARTGIAVLVFLTAMGLYVSFFGSLDVDDQAGYIKYVERGEIKLNPAHLLIEPTCLFFHRFLILVGLSPEIITSIRLLNALAASFSVAVLFVIVDRYFLTCWQSIVIATIAAISFNIFILAISAHPKLLSLPFQALALLYLVGWAAAQSEDRRQHWLVMSAIFLGLASLFLISVLCIAASLLLPFGRYCLSTAEIVGAGCRLWRHWHCRTVGHCAGRCTVHPRNI